MTTISFIPGKSAINLIESFVDNLYENLFLNDTYYGNLLICLSELNDLLIDNSQQKPVQLSYSSDHKTLDLCISGINENIINHFKTYVNHDNNNIPIEILTTLSDSILIEGGYLTMNFDIGALHNTIYAERLKLLSEYFMKQKTKTTV